MSLDGLDGWIIFHLDLYAWLALEGLSLTSSSSTYFQYLQNPKEYRPDCPDYEMQLKIQVPTLILVLVRGDTSLLPGCCAKESFHK